MDHGRDSDSRPIQTFGRTMVRNALRRRARCGWRLSRALPPAGVLVGGWELGVPSRVTIRSSSASRAAFVTKLIDWSDGTDGRCGSQIWVTIMKPAAGFDRPRDGISAASR